MSRGGMRYGAGRPAHRLRDVNTRAIDVRRWQRDKLLNGGYFGWQWTCSETGEVRSNIGVQPSSGTVTLFYTASGESHVVPIRLTSTPCTFGGSRVWFLCPKCSTRCAKLYLRWNQFRCRKCNLIAYSSQCEDLLGRMWIAQSRIEAVLGRHLTRPKHMRQTTFRKLLDRYWQLESQREDAFVTAARRLGFDVW